MDDVMDAQDAEIAELIRRNQNGLRDIRESLQEFHGETQHQGSSLFQFSSSSSHRGSSTGKNRHDVRPQTAAPSLGSLSRSISSESPATSPSNLLGRAIENVDDVENAKAAIAEAQAKMQKLRAEREALERDATSEAQLPGLHASHQRMPGKMPGISAPTSISPDGEESRQKAELATEARQPRRILFFNEGKEC